MTRGLRVWSMGLPASHHGPHLQALQPACSGRLGDQALSSLLMYVCVCVGGGVESEGVLCLSLEIWAPETRRTALSTASAGRNPEPSPSVWTEADVSIWQPAGRLVPATPTPPGRSVTSGAEGQRPLLV